MDKSTQTRSEEVEDELVGLDPELLERQRLFGEKLRSLYNDVTQEPTPESFIALLNELAARESGE